MGSLLFAVLAVASQLDRDYIREKTLEGQAAAAARGNHGGRPTVIDPDSLIYARALRDAGTPSPRSPRSSEFRPARTPAATRRSLPSTDPWLTPTRQHLGVDRRTGVNPDVCTDCQRRAKSDPLLLIEF